MPAHFHASLDARRGPPVRRARMGRAGFFEIDVLAGLFIVAALTMALAAVLGRQHRAVQKLADTRAAMQVAETVLTDLQAGRPGPGSGRGDDTSVEVRPLEEGGAPGAAAGPGVAHTGKWVEVVVSVRGGRASLVGSVPQSAAATTKSPGGAR